MATITPTFTLTSTDAFDNQALSLSVTDSLSVTNPMADASRISAATGGTAIFGTGQAVITYVYVKHTGLLASDGTTSTTNVLTVKDAGGASHATLQAGEFCFFPLPASEGLTLTSTTAAVLAEYAYFSKA